MYIKMYSLLKNTKLYKKYILQEKYQDIILTVYLYFASRYFFIRYRNQLISSSEIIAPKMEYYIMPGGVIWEDENEDRILDRLTFSNVFGFVIIYRTKLIKYPDYEKRTKHLNDKHRKAFYLAKKFFPDWIGFQESRCTYNPALSNRLYRIEKVVSWRLKKFEQELGDDYNQ